MPRPLMMPLVRDEQVGLIRVRPLKVVQDALAGIAELANIAAAVGANEVVLARDTHDVAAACELPIVGPAPGLNMVLATAARARPAPAPLRRAVPVPQPRGLGVRRPGLEAGPRAAARRRGGAADPGRGQLLLRPIELDHPDPFGVTAVPMAETATASA
ncbi:hypothetical protein [Streptomyces globosus]|uniref:hypothetical protein n=1 Tax=Streptomyces globosus TaxID=68209 RepID=UPI0031D0D03D